MNVLGLGLPELIIIALVVLLFFGTSRLPGLFRSFGSSVRELKRGLTEDLEEPEFSDNKDKQKEQITQSQPSAAQSSEPTTTCEATDTTTTNPVTDHDNGNTARS